MGQYYSIDSLTTPRSHFHKFRIGLYAEFSKFIKAPNRHNVAITTAELREVGSSDVMANIHLTITEDAFDLSVIESDGKSQSRPVPE